MTDQNTPDIEADGPESINMSLKIQPEGQVSLVQVGLGLMGPTIIIDVDAEKSLASGDLEMRLRAGGLQGPQDVYDFLEIAMRVVAQAEEVTVEPDEVTDEDIEIFKQAWHESDQEIRTADLDDLPGRPAGSRTRAGLAAVFAARAAR